MELGGYFSVKRNTMSINGDTFLTVDQVVPYCKALLEVFRWGSPLCTLCHSNAVAGMSSNTWHSRGMLHLYIHIIRSLPAHVLPRLPQMSCLLLLAYIMTNRTVRGVHG